MRNRFKKISTIFLAMLLVFQICVGPVQALQSREILKSDSDKNIGDIEKSKDLGKNNQSEIESKDEEKDSQTIILTEDAKKDIETKRDDSSAETKDKSTLDESKDKNLEKNVEHSNEKNTETKSNDSSKINEKLTKDQMEAAKDLDKSKSVVYKQPKVDYEIGEKIDLSAIEILIKNEKDEIQLLTYKDLISNKDIKLNHSQGELISYNYYNALFDKEYLKFESKETVKEIEKYLEKNKIEKYEPKLTIQIPNHEMITIDFNVKKSEIELSPLELFRALKMKNSSVVLLSADKLTYKTNEEINLKNFTFLLKDANGYLKLLQGKDLGKENVEIDLSSFEKEKKAFLSKPLTKAQKEPTHTFITLTKKGFEKLYIPITLVTDDMEINPLDKNSEIDLSTWGAKINKSIFVSTLDVKSLKNVKELNLEFINKLDKDSKIKISRIVKTNGHDEEDISLSDPSLRMVDNIDKYTEMSKEDLAKELAKFDIKNPINLFGIEAGYKYVFFMESEKEDGLEIEARVKVLDEKTDSIKNINKKIDDTNDSNLNKSNDNTTDKNDVSISDKSETDSVEKQNVNVNDEKSHEDYKTLSENLFDIKIKPTPLDVLSLRNNFITVFKAASQPIYNVPSAATEGFVHFIDPGVPKTVKVGNQLYLEWDYKLQYTKQANFTNTFIDHIDNYFTTTLDSGLGKPQIISVTKNGSPVNPQQTGNTSNSNLMHSIKDVINPKSDRGTVVYKYKLRAPIVNVRDNYVMDFHAEAVFKVPAGTIIKDPLSFGGTRLVTQDEITITQAPRRESINSKVKTYGDDLYRINNELQTVYAETGYIGEQAIAGDYINDKQIKWSISQRNVTKGKLNYPVSLAVDDSQDIKSVKVYYYKPDFQNPQNAFILDRTEEADKSLKSISVEPGSITQVEVITDIKNEKVSHKITHAKLEGLKADLTIKKLWKEGGKPVETKFTITGGQNNEINETLTIPAGSETAVKANLPKFTSYGMDGKRIIYDVSENKINGISVLFSTIDDETLTYTFVNTSVQNEENAPTGQYTDYGVIKLDPVTINEYYTSDGWHSYGGRLTGTYRIPANSKSGDYFTLTIPRDLVLDHSVNPYKVFFNMVNKSGTVIGYAYHVEERVIKFVLNSNATSIEDYIGTFEIGERYDTSVHRTARINGSTRFKNEGYYTGFQPNYNIFIDSKNPNNPVASKSLSFESSYHGFKNDMLGCRKSLSTDGVAHYQDAELDAYSGMHKRIKEFGEDYIIYEILLNSQERWLYANRTFSDILTSSISLYHGNTPSSFSKDIEVYEVKGMRNLGYLEDSMKQVYPKRDANTSAKVEVYEYLKDLRITPRAKTMIGYGVDPTYKVNFDISKANYKSILIRMKVRKGPLIRGRYFNAIETLSEFFGFKKVYSSVLSQEKETTGSATGTATDEYQIKLLKVDEKGNPIKSSPVTYRLTDDSGREVGIFMSDKDGNIVVSGMKRYQKDSKGSYGYYNLQEIESPTGYIKDPTVHKIYIDYNGVIWFDAHTDHTKRYDGNIPINMVNKEAYSLKVKKVDENGTAIRGAGFNLKNSDGTYNVTIDGVFNTDNFIFNSLKPGDYTLTEIKVPSGHKGILSPITFTVGNDGKITKTSNNKIESSKITFNEKTRVFEIYVINIKKELGSFKINKTDQDGTALDGAVFTLTPIDPEGTPIVKISKENTGEVKFEGLKPGVYSLVETKAPDGFKKSTKEWRVYVNSEGQTTIQELGAVIPDPGVIEGEDVTNKIIFNGNINYNEKNNNGLLEVGTEENKISINMSMRIPGTIKPGDYFTIKVSDTLHYNMLQPDKITYTSIYNNRKVIADAKFFGSNMNIENGTNKEVTYVFNDNVKGLSDINITLNWENSVNVNVVQYNGLYEFYTQVGDNKISNKFNINHLSPVQKNNLNLVNNYKYTNDQSGIYTQLAYVNPLRLNNSGETTVLVYPAVNEKYFNMADISPDKTKIKVYKFKAGVKIPDAVILDESKLDLLSPSQYKLSFVERTENHQKLTAAEIKLRVNSDAYLIVIDSEMKFPSQHNDKQTILGQYVHLIDSNKNNVRRYSAISTTGSSGTGSGVYEPPVIQVINEKEKAKAQLIIQKTDESGQNKLDNAVFELSGINGYKQEQTTKNGGKVAFTELSAGEYILKEKQAPMGYEKSDYYWKVTVYENGKISITQYNETNHRHLREIQLEDKGNNIFEYSIKNTQKRYNVEFVKYARENIEDSSKDTILRDVEFDLYTKDKKGEFINSNIRVKSDDNGKISIVDLSPGEYQLKEVYAPEGYRLIEGVAKTFRITLDGKVEVLNAEGKYVPNDGEASKIINLKSGTEKFTIIKKDSKGRLLKGVKFELRDSNGVIVSTKETNGEGKITFDNLPFGKYWLTEIRTLDGYVLDTTTRPILLGHKWEVPKDLSGSKDVSSEILLNPEIPSTIVSTEDNPNVVYPNKTEGLIAKLNLLVNPRADIKPGDTFTLKLSENLDLDGIGHVKDSDFDIIAPSGRLAVAKINPDRRSIHYTFTNYLENYRISSFKINTPMFINRMLVPNNAQRVQISIGIGDAAVYRHAINIDYAPYTSGNDAIKSYMTKFNPKTGDFTAVLYVNPQKAYDFNRFVYFWSNQNIHIDNIETYTALYNLPWSYGIDFSSQEGLNRYGLKPIYSNKYIHNVTHKQVIELGRNWSNQNYVIKIEGKALNKGQDFYTYSSYERSYGYGYFIDKWDTWTNFYSPEVGGEGIMEINLLNNKNRIEFTKIEGSKIQQLPSRQDADNGVALGNGANNNDLANAKVYLSNAEFQLKVKKGDQWEFYGNIVTSDEKGIFSWEGLPTGEYQVWEVKAPEGYVLPNTYVSSFRVDENGNIVDVLNGTYIIPNMKEDMKFYIDKIWKNEESGEHRIESGILEFELKAPEGKTFPNDVRADDENEEITSRKYRITKVSEDRTTITLEMDLKTAYEGINDKDDLSRGIKIIVPSDWETGEYTLKETKAPAGFILGKDKYTISIDQKNRTIKSGDTVLYAKGENSEVLNPLKIVNEKGKYPLTGGNGTLYYYLISSIMMLMSLLMIVRKKVNEIDG